MGRFGVIFVWGVVALTAIAAVYALLLAIRLGVGAVALVMVAFIGMIAVALGFMAYVLTRRARASKRP